MYDLPVELIFKGTLDFIFGVCFGVFLADRGKNRKNRKN